MLLCPQLENLENNEVLGIFGGYSKYYDWNWLDGATGPSINVIDFNFKEKIAGTILRDHAIAKGLSELGVKTLLDIGCDSGYFMAVCKQYGIAAVGIDSCRESCASINNKSINKCYNTDIKHLISINENLKFDCISVMNITHVNWNSYAKNGEELKKDLIKWISTQSRYAVLSDISGQKNNWKKYGLYIEKEFDYNIFNFFKNTIFSLHFKYLKGIIFGLIRRIDSKFSHKIYDKYKISNGLEFLVMNKIFKIIK